MVRRKHSDGDETFMAFFFLLILEALASSPLSFVSILKGGGVDLSLVRRVEYTWRYDANTRKFNKEQKMRDREKELLQTMYNPKRSKTCGKHCSIINIQIYGFFPSFIDFSVFLSSVRVCKSITCGESV